MLDPSLALQDAVYAAIKDIVAAYYDVPDDAQLPYAYFGDDDIVMTYDAGGEFADTTANVEVFAADKITLKELVAKVVQALDAKIEIEGFDVMEWRVGPLTYRTMQDGLTQQASLEFDYLIQSDE